MRNLFTAFILCFLFSCNNEKTLRLPEIMYADTNEVLDVSHAYIFYDESKPDSLELNRKNLIGTTNWLINVDKRLTLDQAIPQVRFLQDKKRSAKMHKNDAAKNYFTCSDSSIKNLGFIEFTDVVYKTYEEEKDLELNNKPNTLKIFINSMDNIIIDSFENSSEQTSKTIIKALTSRIDSLKAIKEIDKSSDPYIIYFIYNKRLNFQNYISIKSLFKDFKLESATISKNEFIN